MSKKHIKPKSQQSFLSATSNKSGNSCPVESEGPTTHLPLISSILKGNTMQTKEIKINTISNLDSYEFIQDYTNDPEQANLQKNLKENGQIVPISVTPVPQTDGKENGETVKYRLLDGYRRIKALQSLNFDTVRVTVVDGAEAKVSLVTQAAAHFQKREHDNPVLQCEFLTKMKSELGFKDNQKLADAIHLHRTKVSRILNLQGLPKEVIDAARKSRFTINEKGEIKAYKPYSLHLFNQVRKAQEESEDKAIEVFTRRHKDDDPRRPNITLDDETKERIPVSRRASVSNSQGQAEKFHSASLTTSQGQEVDLQVTSDDSGISSAIKVSISLPVECTKRYLDEFEESLTRTIETLLRESYPNDPEEDIESDIASATFSNLDDDYAASDDEIDENVSDEKNNFSRYMSKRD